MGASKLTSQPLLTLSDIRTFFLQNEIPVYFIDFSAYDLIGMEEWIGNFRFINSSNSFDGFHPQAFVPKRKMPNQSGGLEGINNALLQDPQVLDLLARSSSNGTIGKAMFLLFDDETERLAKQLGLEICFPQAVLRRFLDDKVTTTRIAENAGVPCVPNVLSRVENYEQLRCISQQLGEHLVLQMPFGDSGETTFFISSEADFERNKAEITNGQEVKIMKRIRCRGTSIEACVTRYGVVVGPLVTELIGFQELTPFKGGWCGNELFPNAFPPGIRQQAREYTIRFGEQLRKEGYLGYFDLDFLLDEDDGSFYLGELNPRISGVAPLTNNGAFAKKDLPLILLHLLEWMGVDYLLDVEALNQSWSNQANLDTWSSMIFKHLHDETVLPGEPPASGVWRMNECGCLSFVRQATNFRAIQSADEGFFLREANKGDVVQNGDFLGVLFLPKRVMSDYQLTAEAKAWIAAIRKGFEG